MRLRLKAANKDTGKVHEIFDHEVIEDNVKIGSSGNLDVIFKARPGGGLTGQYDVKLDIPLSELHYIVGVVEQEKLALLVKQASEIKRLTKKDGS